jgi:hypothetical protein
VALLHGLGHKDLIGRPLESLPESMPGLRIIPTEDAELTKATYDGTYTDAKGDKFLMRVGQILPDGAVADPDPNAEPKAVKGDGYEIIKAREEAAAIAKEDEERAKKAPANRSKGNAPENRAE